MTEVLRSITCRNDYILPPHGFKADDLLNKSTVFYGASGTGKTFGLFSLTHLLQPHIDLWYVFSPTAGLDRNSPYNDDVIPAMFRCHRLDFRKLKLIIDGQELKVTIYNKSNDPQILFEILSHLPESKTQLSIYKSMYNKVNIDIKSLPPDKKARVELAREKIIVQLKIRILRNRDTLFKLDSQILPEDLKTIIKNIHRKPDIGIIFDDMGPEMKKASGELDLLLDELYTRGRHYRITFFNLLQDLTQLKPGQRTNGMNFIFTDPASAIRYANDTKDRNIKDAFSNAIFTIFHTTDDKYKYIKLLYFRNPSPTQPSICYTKFHNGSPTRLCSEKYFQIANAQTGNRILSLSSTNTFASSM